MMDHDLDILCRCYCHVTFTCKEPDWKCYCKCGTGKDGYPPDFIDALRAKAAMGWAQEHEALLQEIDKLTNMLIRIHKCMVKGYISNGDIDEDIKEFWEKNNA